MIRRLNFTGRRRIARGDAMVRLRPDGAGRLRVEARLSLERYALPENARVYVEAHRQTSWQRFDFGTVGRPAAPPDPVLRAFGSGQGVRFRVRVVEAAGDAPRVLAGVDDLRPALLESGRDRGLSLLPVDWGDFRGHTWKLELDEESGPLLRVSRALVGEREAFVGSREFVSLVLPAVLRQILERALIAAGDAEEATGWPADWIHLARALPGVGAPPPRTAAAETLTDEEEDWLDAVAEAFALARQVPERFQAWWSGAFA